MRRTKIGWLGATGTGLVLVWACKSGAPSVDDGAGGTTTTSTSTSKTTSTSTGTGTSSGTVTGSGTGTGTGSTSASTSTGSSSSSSSGGAAGTVTPAPGESVLTHHKNPNRDGVYVEAALTEAAVSTLHKDATFTPSFTGSVYAQPLYLDSTAVTLDAGTGVDLVIVATTNADVVALSSVDGHTVWSTHLGTPSPLASLTCGNIDPNGVIGTPVIDLASRALFVDALINVGASATPKHILFALSIDTGAVLTGWPVDVAAALSSSSFTFNAKTQGERGALAVVNGTVYVPYGGLYGDCPPYHGFVLAVSTTDPTKTQFWSTTLQGGGAWTPGGVSADSANIYIATGNTYGDVDGGVVAPWGGGDATLRLPATSTPAIGDYFAPANWYQLDNGDLDMGTSPIPFDLPGSSPSELALTFGKDGNAYLLDRTHLGGVGGAIGATGCTATTNNGCATLHVANNDIIGAPALYSTATATYVAFKGSGALCTNGVSGPYLTTLKILPGSPPTLAGSWCSASGGTGSPIVTTSGNGQAIVWMMGSEHDNLLHAFDGDTGTAIPFTGSTTVIPNTSRYNSPIAAKGRIFVPAVTTVVAFTL